MIFSVEPTVYDWYKHLTTVDGTAIVAVGAFLQFGGDDITNALVYWMAFGAILFFFVSVGASVGGMYIAIFKPQVPGWYFVAFPTFLVGLVAFFIAVGLHLTRL